MNWKLIETAPKDGTTLLLLNKKKGEVNTGYWGYNEWCSNGCIDDWLTFNNITHWCELPELPKEEV